MRTAFAVVSILVLAVAAAGCGSSKSSAPPTTTALSLGSTTSSSSSSTSSSSSSSSSSFGSAKNCTQLLALGTKVSQALQAQSASGTTNLQAEANIIKKAAGAAPSAIRGDIQTLAGAFGSYAAALKTSGFKPGTTPTATQLAALAAAVQSLNAPKLQAAEQHLSAWAHANCKTANG